MLGNTYYDWWTCLYYKENICQKKKKHLKNFNAVDGSGVIQKLPFSTFRITFTVEMNILCTIMG